MEQLLMTEADWQACDNPVAMLHFCQSGQSNRRLLKNARRVKRRIYDPALQRKLRLVACGICRRIWHDLPEGAYRRAIEAAERYADGEADRDELESARAMLLPDDLPFEEATRSKIDRAVKNAMRTYDNEEHVGRLFYVALSTAWEIGELESIPRTAWNGPTAQWDAYADSRGAGYFSGQAERAAILRDAIPSPFRDVEFDAGWLSWNNDTIKHMARTIYESHRFQEMPILADALEEAGCAEAGILDHCRRATWHVRGCWVIDLLLSRP